MDTNFIPLIVIEIFLAAAILYLLIYCDKRVIEFRKILDSESRGLIKSIKDLQKELIKLNFILEKFSKTKETDWLKIITKIIDVINLLLFLAPLGKKIPFAKKLFSIKSIKKILSLAR